MLAELIARLRSEEMTLEEFSDAVNEVYVPFRKRSYPETDEATLPTVKGIREAELHAARRAGTLTTEEFQTVMTAIRNSRRRRT